MKTRGKKSEQITSLIAVFKEFKQAVRAATHEGSTFFQLGDGSQELSRLTLVIGHVQHPLLQPAAHQRTRRWRYRSRRVSQQRNAFVLAMQCISTTVIVRRETGDWRWPLIQLVGINVLAWGGLLWCVSRIEIISPLPRLRASSP